MPITNGFCTRPSQTLFCSKPPARTEVRVVLQPCCPDTYFRAHFQPGSWLASTSSRPPRANIPRAHQEHTKQRALFFLEDQVCSRVSTGSQRLTTNSLRTSYRLWIINGAMDAHAAAEMERRAPNGGGTAQCELRC